MLNVFCSVPYCSVLDLYWQLVEAFKCTSLTSQCLLGEDNMGFRVQIYREITINTDIYSLSILKKLALFNTV